MKTSFLTTRQARVQRIHDLLAKGRAVTCRQIARELEFSARTIQRDVTFMREELLLPIEYEREHHTFVYVGPVTLTMFGQAAPSWAQATSSASAGLPLDEEPAEHLAVICERHGLRAKDVLRAVIGITLADAVCNSTLMAALVRSARSLATLGDDDEQREAA